MVDFTPFTAIRVPVRRWENAQRAAFLAGKISGQPRGCWAELQRSFGRGRRRKERREVQRGCSLGRPAGPGSLQAQAANLSTWLLPEVSKPSCHKQLMELAFQVRKPGINKSNAKRS